MCITSQQFCHYLLSSLPQTHMHTLVWIWHGRSVWGEVRLDHSILVVVSQGGDSVWTDGVYLVAGWLDHLTTPLRRPYHFGNSHGATNTHAGCAHTDGRAHTGKKDLHTVYATPLIWTRGDNSPSRCQGKDRDKRGVTKWERKRTARQGE